MRIAMLSSISWRTPPRHYSPWENMVSLLTEQLLKMAEKYLDAYTKILDKRQNYRPWGHYEILSERESHKVKSIIVQPGKRLSLQKHKRRAEHWVVVSGTAIVTLGEKQIPLKAGESVDIPRGATHRIMNPGSEPLTFVEAQMGDYFGEDDIIRLEDDFGRVE